jgi:hypothetical protein
MSSTALPDAVARFPRVPPRLAAAHGDWTRALHLRAFPRGRDDLDIELDESAGPHVVTAILARCVRRADGEPVDPRFLWALEVGARIECLLRIAALGGARLFPLRLRCGNAACGQPLELELTIEELLALRGEHDAPFAAAVGGASRRLRSPTGEDQLALHGRTYADIDDAARAFAASLLEDGEPQALRDADVEEIERSLAEHDPLVGFSVLAACPHCGADEEHEVDLAGLALGALRDARDALLSDIHVLASRYHWSEPQILEIPAGRRARYLALVDREARRGS